LISGSTAVSKTRELKEKTTTIFRDACFKLHKWHSNVPELESEQLPQEEGEPTYPKQQSGVPQGAFSSMLWLLWNKEKDSLSITVPPEKATLSKRGKLAKIYYPLGLISPETLSGKLIYRAVCDTKGAWDADLSCDLAKLWVVGKQTARKFYHTEIANCSSRGNRANRSTCVPRCTRKWSRRLQLCSHSTSIRN